MSNEEIQARLTTIENQLETYDDNLAALEKTRKEVIRLRDAINAIAKALPAALSKAGTGGFQGSEEFSRLATACTNTLNPPV